MELMDTVKKTGKAIEKALSIAPEKAGDMDILDKLEMEHDEVKALLKQLVESKSGAQRKLLLKKVKALLVPHARAEEKVVYNAIISQKEKELKENGEEGYIEHSLVDKILGTLSKTNNAMSPAFSAGSKVLKELLEHHISEEQRDVWRDVKKHYGSDARILMNRKFEAEKKKVRVA